MTRSDAVWLLVILSCWFGVVLVTQSDDKGFDVSHKALANQRIANRSNYKQKQPPSEEQQPPSQEQARIEEIMHYLSFVRDSWHTACIGSERHHNVTVHIPLIDAWCARWNSITIGFSSRPELLLKLRYKSVDYVVHPSIGPSRAVLALSLPGDPLNMFKCSSLTVSLLRTLCLRDSGSVDYDFYL